MFLNVFEGTVEPGVVTIDTVATVLATLWNADNRVVS